ncbi:CBS domain-containing protein [Streptomyces sp. NPDC056921]|uniref:CBS domain-containing protein n=1 Tax=Streptomyces sp. NPDC056921 TaxID=3345966 RepID=UPI00363FDD72
MKHIRVGDLMTDDVISVVSLTSFKEVAKLLAQHDISGLPVLDDEDRVVGVVSESDLLGRQAAGHSDAGATNPSGSEFTAADVMSAPAVTVHAQESAREAARLMTRSGVERLPVVDDEDRLVGIVTRRDLLRLFLRPDAEIRRRVIHDVLESTMGLAPDAVTVHVVDGVVTLEGRLESRSRLAILVYLVEQLDGVVAVVSRATAPADGPVPASLQEVAHGPSAGR